MVVTKRFFDLVVCSCASLVWMPAIVFVSLAACIMQGRPIFYSSPRRVFKDKSAQVIKFRAMVKNADKIVNRDTVPVSDKRFLNLDLDNPLYTPLGRFLERSQLVEIPQFFLVLQGKMSLVGNRPLPENVIASLKLAYPEAERRFDTPAGVAGPVQLIGRINITDKERLDIEIAYADFCLVRYSFMVDLIILFNTVLVTLGVRQAYTADQVKSLLS